MDRALGTTGDEAGGQGRGGQREDHAMGHHGRFPQKHQRGRRNGAARVEGKGSD